MTSSDDSDTHRAAIAKAQEGHRLLVAGDYEGAIPACTEAIELNPGSIGARRTRAEAYRRLGRGREAEADLKHLAQASEVVRPRQSDEDSIREENGFLAELIFNGALLLLVAGGMMWAQMAGRLQGPGGMTAILVGVPFLLFISWRVIRVLEDLAYGTDRQGGIVARKGIAWDQDPNRQGESVDHYWMEVAGRRVRVSETMYNWVYEADQVMATFYPRTNRVVEISRIASRRLRELKQAEQRAEDAREAQQWKPSPTPSLPRSSISPFFSRFEIAVFGADARLLERPPFEEEVEALAWFEIADSPIRWVESTWWYSMRCYVPDPRIGPDFPPVMVHWVPVKEVVGSDSEPSGRNALGSFVAGGPFGDPFQYFGESRPFDKEISESVANRINHDPALSAMTFSPGIELFVSIAPALACWELFVEYYPSLDRSLWKCCEAIAHCLLAMPMPTDG